MRRIGHGAFGEVWLARNIFGSPRAVKVVYRRNFSDAYPFEREFKGIQKYEPVSGTHAGLVQILQVGQNREHGYFYYVMELADAADGSAASTVQPLAQSSAYIPKTLRAELRQRGRLPGAECVNVAVPLAEALQHLHDAGLLHRDIKPSNIIFVRGAPKLADIGLVADMDEARSFVGTMGFIPPEGPGTPQGDVYGLGKVLYEMLSGKDRHEFPALPDQFLSHNSGRSEVGGDERELVSGLNQIVLRACESNRRIRYPSARAMLEDLLALQRGDRLRRSRWLAQVWSRSRTVLAALASRRRAWEAHSTVPEANHLFEKGHLCALGATPERLRQASKYFSEAVELDPRFVPAHIGIFRVRLLELTALPSPSADAVARVRAAAVNLIGAAPDLAEAKMASSLLKFLEGNLPAALEEARAAAAMRVCSRQTHAVSYGLAGACLLEMGQAGAALAELRRSEQAVPTCAIGQVSLGHPYFVQGKYDLALAQYQRSIELEPRQHLGHFWKGKVYEELADFGRAIDAFEQADLRSAENEASADSPSARDVEDIRRFYGALRSVLEREGSEGYWRERLQHALNGKVENPHLAAVALAKLGRTDEAYACLNRACAAGNLRGLCFDHCWNREDPRFQSIARQVGLGWRE